jgi:hypothetical protein
MMICGRLQVAMNDPSIVGGRQPLTDLHTDRNRFVLRQRSAVGAFSKSDALDKFEDKKADLVNLFDSINCGNIIVPNSRKGLCFRLQQSEAACILRKFRRKDLDRYRPFEAGIERAIHLAHAPAPINGPISQGPNFEPVIVDMDLPIIGISETHTKLTNSVGHQTIKINSVVSWTKDMTDERRISVWVP